MVIKTMFGHGEGEGGRGTVHLAWGGRYMNHTIQTKINPGRAIWLMIRNSGWMIRSSATKSMLQTAYLTFDWEREGGTNCLISIGLRLTFHRITNTSDEDEDENLEDSWKGEVKKRQQVAYQNGDIILGELFSHIFFMVPTYDTVENGVYEPLTEKCKHEIRHFPLQIRINGKKRLWHERKAPKNRRAKKYIQSLILKYANLIKRRSISSKNADSRCFWWSIKSSQCK